MAIRPLVIPAGLGLFFLASALVALNLSSLQPAGDTPVTATSHPTPTLEVTVILNHGRLVADRPLTVHVELTNTGTAPMPLPPDGGCLYLSPLRLELLDAAGRVVWSQPIPMIACPEQQSPLYRKLGLLNPGETRTADACFQLAGLPGQCVRLELPNGSYRVAGTDYGVPLPQTGFRIAR
jgi:hypothetical protein